MMPQACPLCDGETQPVHWIPGHFSDGVEAVEVGCARCGDYVLTLHAYKQVLGIHGEESRALLSAVTREAFEQETPIRLYSDVPGISDRNPGWYSIVEALEKFPRSVPERMDRALRVLARASLLPGDEIALDIRKGSPLLFAENQSVAEFTLRHLVWSGLLAEVKGSVGGGGQYALTVAGWEKAKELDSPRPEGRRAFVAMWFDDEMDGAYEQGLRPAIAEAGYEAERVKEDRLLGKVCDHIIAQIRRSQFLVADVTGHREAVYFEAGYAMGLGLPVIFTCHKRDEDTMCFDTRQYKHILWTEHEQLKAELRDTIVATIPPPGGK